MNSDLRNLDAALAKPLPAGQQSSLARAQLGQLADEVESRLAVEPTHLTDFQLQRL
jgi:hypothetical protein